MKITRLNYELYALDYIEGKLPQEEQQAMADFLQEHPDLEAELEAMVNYLPLKPDTEVVFEPKERLLRHEAKIVVTRLFLRRVASVAAAVLLLLAGYLIGMQRGTQPVPPSPIANIVHIKPEVQLVRQTPEVSPEEPVVVPSKPAAPKSQAPVEQAEQVAEANPAEPTDTLNSENELKNIPHKPIAAPLTRLASVSLEPLPQVSEPNLNPEQWEVHPSDIKVKPRPGRELVRFARNLVDKLPLEDIEFSPIPSYYANARQTSMK